MLCFELRRTNSVVHIVTNLNRGRFKRQIDQMHRDRKRLFVDRLKWDVSVIDGEFEIDEFDTDRAIYLIETDPTTARHVASVRFLPTTQPHILSTVFSSLCDGPVPIGEDILELTRLCVSPDLAKSAAVSMCHHMWIASVEFALLFGISRYTGVSQAQFLSSLLSSGWEIEPLGLPRDIDGQITGAVAMPITPDTLRRARARFGYRYPVLEVIPQTQAA
jgi:N-acyl-L-homoserine lactone synthetase